MRYNRLKNILDDFRIAAYCFGAIFLLLAVVPTGKAFDKVTYFDKFAHFVGFYFFTFFMIASYKWSLKGRLVTLAIALAFGASIEILQGFLPWRSKDYYDFVWDAIGAITAGLTPNFIFRYIMEAIATVGFVGFVPIAPGTITAALALGIYYAAPISWSFLNFAVPAMLVLGLWASHYVSELHGHGDPPFIVVDEAVGVLVGVMFMPKTLPILVTAFVIFRIFDIFKPLGINKLQDLPGGIGIMADDLLAGLYTLIIVGLTHILGWL